MFIKLKKGGDAYGAFPKGFADVIASLLLVLLRGAEGDEAISRRVPSGEVKQLWPGAQKQGLSVQPFLIVTMGVGVMEQSQPNKGQPEMRQA